MRPMKSCRAASTALPAMAQQIAPLADCDATQIDGARSADQRRDASI